jgi:hypothetical protein
MTPMSVRQFSVSSTREATVCVQNPLKDDDGNDMILEITPRAAKVGYVHIVERISKLTKCNSACQLS